MAAITLPSAPGVQQPMMGPQQPGVTPGLSAQQQQILNLPGGGSGLSGAETALLQAALLSQNALQGGEQQARTDLTQGALTGRTDITQGEQTALGQIGTAQTASNQQFQQGIDPLQQFISPGANAQQIQAALSGAQGQQAFDAALVESPVQKFLREQGRNEILASAGATGGLGGGAVRKELSRFGQGQAATRLQDQINNLNALTGQGLTAAGEVGRLRGQQAGGTRELGRVGADITGTAALTRAGIAGDEGRGLADVSRGTARDLGASFVNLGGQAAENRFQTGRDTAAAIGKTTSALSDLINQQGTDLQGVTDVGGSNIANLLTNAAGAAGLSDEQLAALIANLQTGQASTVAGLPGVPGVQQQQGALEGIGQAAGGAAALIAASDVRLKRNIRRVGHTGAGLGLYSWDWKPGTEHITAGQPTYGVLAQEVEQTQPAAVLRHADGFLRVNYGAVA